MELFGNLLLCDRERADHVELKRGVVRVDSGHITEVIVGDQPAHFDFGGEDCLICPGLVDAHVHLPQFDMIGAHGLPLLEWLQRHTFPAELRWNDPTYAMAMTHRVMDQCFAHGTTAMAAYATSNHDATLAAMQIAKSRGMSGVVGQVLMDRGGPDGLVHPVDQQIDQSAAAFDRYCHDDRLAFAITPRFAVACTDNLLAAAGGLAQRSQAIVQTHLAETVAECELVSELFDGRSYVDVYDDAGLLNRRTIFGHGIHLDDDDRSKLSAAGARIAHCPTANSFLRSGTMNRHQHRLGDVQLCLGSDVGAGYERSMVRVGRAMIEAAATCGGPLPSAAHAWWMITHGNMAALQRPTDERLSPGQPADILIIRPNVPWLNAGDADNSLAQLMFSWDDRWIDTTFAAGAVVYRARAF